MTNPSLCRRKAAGLFTIIFGEQAMAVIVVFLLVLLFPVPSTPLRSSGSYLEAPKFYNTEGCPTAAPSYCDPFLVNIAMTLDLHYLRGSIAAVHSILRHSPCPETLFFHFITDATAADLSSTIRRVFPSLRFRTYIFHGSLLRRLISSTPRYALENPLNYARNYLAELLQPCIRRVIYLDSDLIFIDDIRHLWDSAMAAYSSNPKAVIAAPEYCQANFTRYFTAAFWNGVWKHSFEGRRRRPCYFNTGVMAIELERWREGNYGAQIERWMEIQKRERIYDLGSLPPFLLVFAGGEIEPLDHRWNQHGLGGDNVKGSCRSLHPGPVSVLHWSGKGKPWDRMDSGEPCFIDYLWEMYDLHASSMSSPSITPMFS